MLRINSYLTVILTALVLFSAMNQCHAIEITAIHPRDEIEPFVHNYDVQTYNGSNGYHTTVAITDIPFFGVDFYIDWDYKGSVSSLNDETDAIFWFNSLYGSIQGTPREIKAVAYTLDGDIDYDSYTVTVWDGIIDYDSSDNVYIWAAINRHFYRDGQITSVHRGGAYYNRDFEGDAQFFYRFKREVIDPNGMRTVFDPVEGNYQAVKGEYTEYPEYSWSVPAGQAGDWSSKAYTTIQADGATATATSTESFHVPAW